MPIENTLVPRPVDGTGTNTNHSDWGATDTDLLRIAPSDLGPDGEMSGADRPNARAISNAVAQQSGDMPNAAGASDFLWIWGQFLDHDLSLTEAGSTVTADIEVPIGDPHFDPMGLGGAVIPFNRVDQHDGAYINEITGFIDASMIYGSDAETVTKMRVEGGKLLMTEDAQLMLEGANLVTGDVRAAENVALSSMHTIFTREHNRIVDELAAEYPDLTDDQLFEGARARVEGIVQAITFNDFLPILVGADAIGSYSGYDDAVNPGISIEFSTAVYRLGHTLLSSNLKLVEEDGTEKTPLALRDAFFRPSLLTQPDMIEDVFRGAATQHSQALDTKVVEDVRSFLFGPPGAGGLDLASLNIQRGRDLGIASYNDLREAIGLTRAESFSDITSDTDLAAALEAIYGDTDKVDAWVGGLAEDPVGDGMLGETFSTILVDQFTRLRDGDPFWSEGRTGLSDAERGEIWNTQLSDVILRNTDVDAIQKNVFMTMNRIIGSDESDTIKGTGYADFAFGGDGNDKLRGRKGDDDLQGGAGNDDLRGNRGDDILDGGTGNDLLIGGFGDDTLLGGDGQDSLRGARGNDVLEGGAGADMLNGARGDDTLRGDEGNDTLRGHDGDDILEGGEGNDRLNGQYGNDTLTGGAGSDCFIFNINHSGANVITDFEIGCDVLKFRNGAEASLDMERIGNDLVYSHDGDWSLILEDYFA